MKNKPVTRAARTVLKIGMLCAATVGLSACYVPGPPPPPVAYAPAPAPAYYAPGYYAAPAYPAYGYYAGPSVGIGLDFGGRGRRW